MEIYHNGKIYLNDDMAGTAEAMTVEDGAFGGMPTRRTAYSGLNTNAMTDTDGVRNTLKTSTRNC